MRPSAEVVGRFVGRRILVLGDVMLDSYLDGRAWRLSREAPVPIVAMHGRRDAPGGAANTASNARSLGADVRLLGLVGADSEAQRLREALTSSGVQDADLVADTSRTTLAKVRVLADGQLLLRLDSGSTSDPEPATRRRMRSLLAELHAWTDAVIVSDYGYGVVNADVLQELIQLQRSSPKLLVGDAKDVGKLAAASPTFVKPNYFEACQVLGLSPRSGAEDRAHQITEHSARLHELTGAENAVVTLDGQGSVLLRPEQQPYRTHAVAVSNDRATGAGDTFSACLTLALTSGEDPSTAVEIASAAAAIAVRKRGTATCEAPELAAALAGTGNCADAVAIAKLLERERRRGARVVFTNGCFDILHPGHVAYLNQAKGLGDTLVVAVNSDASVRRLKGPNRPVNSLNDRIEVLSALGCVDHIVSFDDDRPDKLIRLMRPDIFVKGGDYSIESLPEADIVQQVGGEIRILPLVPDRSTSRILERIGDLHPAASATRSGP